MRVILRGELQRKRAIDLITVLDLNHTTYQVEIGEYEEDKTKSQRNYWHTLIGQLAGELGYSKGEMKEVLKLTILGPKTITLLSGEEKEVPPSSEDERKAGYSRLIDETIRIAAELGHVLS